MVVLAFFGYLAALRMTHVVEEMTRAPANTVEQAGELATTIAERFKTGTITTTFTAALPRLVPDGGTTLELATLEAIETFTKTDERRVLFDLVTLGKNVTEIRAPATYRYHVRLGDPWRIEVRDQACVVFAPRLRPTLPPAVHTDRMEKQSTSGWLRFDAEEQMEELTKSITPTLSKRAAAPETLELVRHRARRRVAEFVRNWLLHEEHWRADRFRSVTVVFADEEPSDVAERESRPTIVLEDDGAISTQPDSPR
jgi:hypothetical protein